MASIHGRVLREELDDGVVRLLLSRPERANAWGPDMADSLLERLAEVAASDDVRACILTGDGDRAFSSGADIGAQGAHETPSAGRYLAEHDLAGQPVFDALASFPKPLVCAVNGHAIGAGFLIALHCDVVLAAERASFAMPQVRLGVLPAYGGLHRLAQWVGRGRALEIGLTGRRVGAREAADIGLASRVCADDELSAVALETAATLGGLPPLAVRLAKDSLEMAYQSGGGQVAARVDLYRFAMLGLTEDCAEAHTAWRERRTPTFRRR